MREKLLEVTCDCQGCRRGFKIHLNKEPEPRGWAVVSVRFIRASDNHALGVDLDVCPEHLTEILERHGFTKHLHEPHTGRGVPIGT